MLDRYLQYFKPTTLVEIHEDLTETIENGTDDYTQSVFLADLLQISEHYKVLTGEDIQEASGEPDGIELARFCGDA